MTKDEMINMLSKYGSLRIKDIDYVTFRGSRNLSNRSTHTTEYLFILNKTDNPGKIEYCCNEKSLFK